MGNMNKLGAFELNQCYIGDCLELMQQIPDKSIDLLATDPPYGVLGKTQDWDNVDIKKFTRKWWSIAKSKMKENSSAYIFWSLKYLSVGLKIFNPHRMLIWHHSNLAKPTNKMFLWTYDPIFYIKFGKPIFEASFCRKENVDVFQYPKPQSNWDGDKMRFHPASKPVELMCNFIKVSSKKDDIVLDPFVGAGTTLVAAKRLHRNFLGFEMIKEYKEITDMRLAQDCLL